jgi:hypothetical protein
VRNTIRARVRWILVSALVGGACLGCGSDEPAGTVQVNGTVTLDGQPVPGASVAFAGKGGTRLATAETDSAGRFTIRPAEGANAVAVSKGSTSVMPPPTDGDMLMPTDAEFQKMPTPETVIPAKYGDPNTSGISFNCVEGMDVDIALSSK